MTFPTFFHETLLTETNVFSVKMRYVAAYLLAVIGGNASPSAKDVTEILASVGVEADKTQLDIVMKELKGKDVMEVMEAGRAKLADVPSGGAVAAGGAAPAAAAAAAEEAPKKEKTPEPESDSDSDMGMGLFD